MTCRACASRTADARSASASGALRQTRPGADEKQASAFRYCGSVTRTLALEFAMSRESNIDSVSTWFLFFERVQLATGAFLTPDIETRTSTIHPAGPSSTALPGFTHVRHKV